MSSREPPRTGSFSACGEGVTLNLMSWRHAHRSRARGADAVVVDVGSDRQAEDASRFRGTVAEGDGDCVVFCPHPYARRRSGPSNGSRSPNGYGMPNVSFFPRAPSRARRLLPFTILVGVHHLKASREAGDDSR